MKRKKFRARIWYVALVCLLVLAVIGCSQSASPVAQGGTQPESGGEPKLGGTITIGLSAEPDTLDIHKTNMSASEVVTRLIGGALLSMDPETKEVKPYLAESYSISDDQKTWTFKIRSGITFHDGTSLTAASFKATYERAMAPETASPGAGPLLGVIESISAPDEKTLILQLKEPSAPLLSYLIQPNVTQPLSMAAIEQYGKEYGRNPVGVGPWKFESWKTGESITLVRNEAYKWAEPFAKVQGPPMPDKLVIKFIKDAQTTIAALESGSIDIASISAKEAKEYRSNGKFEVLEATKLGVNFIQMNLENEILQDLRVRQALNMALNKKAIIQADQQGEGESAFGPLPRKMFGYDPAVETYGYPFNVEEAKKLLEDAGWKTGAGGIREKDGKPLSLQLLTAMNSQGIPLIQSMLKDIGVEIKVQNAELGSVLDLSAKGQFDLNVLGYTDLDPDILYLFMHSSQIGGLNHSHIQNPQLDALLEKSRTVVDPVQRQQIFMEIQKIAVEQAYWIPYSEEKTFLAVNKRVHGVKLDAMYGIMLGESWMNQ
ncbi:peptide ABC transporter substrate-binding protein [Brevibacillus reuszeri]|uniref:Peptide ABC transporter substrate-binding protein n=1 Tax=Brevibacillus reuszeri TaxID=54915 RepID=A0ABQ0TLA3_9BACL|nr:ABC transporter substrate-binding protein [Brevibacillus reuszeri]MED1858364.1 ABC transporter substrate-binding protein [Brevibacillus reuszeri]GED68636.1 peptide ABC transporter substrate-binding protein [Brevibacillus reuszeri]